MAKHPGLIIDFTHTSAKQTADIIGPALAAADLRDIDDDERIVVQITHSMVCAAFKGSPCNCKPKVQFIRKAKK